LPLILALLAIPILAALAWAGYPLLQSSQEEPVPQIAVPDLVGKTLEEAEKQVGNDFKMEVRDEVENEEPVDTILSQQPQGGKAEKGSTISVNVVGTQVADVPGVVGQGRDEAEQTLKNAGFEVAVQERESSFDDEGQVIGQIPRGGTSVEVNSQVTITVGTGPQAVKVPDLYGNTPDQAARILEGVGLKLGEQTEAPSDEAAEGQIIEQQPTAGAAVEPGSEVSVTVSSGPELRTVPNVVGQSAEQARAQLWNAYFASTVLTVPGDEPEGTVVSTDPPAGTRADWRAITVTVNVSAGPPETTAAPARERDDNGGADRRAPRVERNVVRGGEDNGGNNAGNNGGPGKGNNN